MKRANREELGNRDKVGARAIFCTPPPSFTETACSYKLINSLLWRKPVGSKFYNTYNQKSHHLLKFLFWPFPWTVDMMIWYYPFCNLVMNIQENNYWNFVISLFIRKGYSTYKKSPSPKKSFQWSHRDNWSQHQFQSLIQNFFSCLVP